MDNKSKFITAGSSSIVLAICLLYFGNEGSFFSTSSGDSNAIIIGIILLVAGVAALSIGFTSKRN